jgi:hypothetical protein
MAGMRPLGLIFKYSGALCSRLPKSRYTDSYVNPSSSRTIATFLGGRIGVQVPVTVWKKVGHTYQPLGPPVWVYNVNCFP